MGGPDDGTPSNDRHAFDQEQATSELDQSISDRQQETERRQRLTLKSREDRRSPGAVVAMED
jgi:hypothetical protein